LHTEQTEFDVQLLQFEGQFEQFPVELTKKPGKQLVQVLLLIQSKQLVGQTRTKNVVPGMVIG